MPLDLIFLKMLHHIQIILLTQNPTEATIYFTIMSFSFYKLQQVMVGTFIKLKLQQEISLASEEKVASSIHTICLPLKGLDIRSNATF